MSIFQFFKKNESPSPHPQKAAPNNAELEKKVTRLSNRIIELEGQLKDTQSLIQYIANAHYSLANDMSVIHANLQEVIAALNESADPWGFDPDDGEGSGGGYLN